MFIQSDPIFGFSKVTGTHATTDARAEFWMPRIEHLSPVLSRDEAVTIQLGKERRSIMAKHLHMALKFNREFALRESLNHDCVVFALACTTGQSFDNVRMGGEIGPRLDVHLRSSEKGRLGELEVSVDTLVFTALSRRDTTHDRTHYEDYHFAVKTSLDEGKDLYLSKLGASGRVVLSDAGNLERFYPGDTVGVVDTISLASR